MAVTSPAFLQSEDNDMISPEIGAAVDRVALAHGMEAAGLKAFVEEKLCY